MTFFTDPTPFTHFGSLYGIPVYLMDLDTDGPTVAGTNAVWEWCLLHVAPWLQFAGECVMHLATGGQYVSEGFPFKVKGELPPRRR